jgi:hypothetical protein
MAFLDKSVADAVAAAKNVGGQLSYTEVQEIIKSVFDNGQITMNERDDLREVLKTMPMDGRGTRALVNFLSHLDYRFAAADANAKATGNRNWGMKVTVPDPGPFTKINTDLGKFSHGNFDVRYAPAEGELIVTLKVDYDFDKGVNAAEQAAIKTRMQQAVDAWDKARATLETVDFVLNPVIRIRFELREVAKGSHKTVEVTIDGRREWVGMDININKLTTTDTLIHELGHVYGNYDEYKGSGFMAWVERRMWWHDNDHLDDTDALMNSGNHFRARYFDHFEKFVNEHFARIGAKYTAKV